MYAEQLSDVGPVWLPLLDEQPGWLAPAHLVNEPLPEARLRLNPSCHMSWRAGSSAMGLDIIYVGGGGVDPTIPFRVGPSLRRRLDDLIARRLVPSDLPAHERRLLFAAGILVDDASALGLALRLADFELAAQQLQARGYTPLLRLIHGFHVGALRLYYRRLARSGAMVCGDAQSALRYVVKNDPAAVFHHRRLTPIVSRLVARPVKPSYVYVAAYQPGAQLPRHRDRAQCEYSITFCLDFTPDSKLETFWPLHLETFEGPRPVFQALGDALVYRGRAIEHHRDLLPAGCASTSLFFHYVDTNFCGPLQ